MRLHLPVSHRRPSFSIIFTSVIEFYDEIDIMNSLARPRKITILGSNGQIYMFLGKPKDDLRKDARLMDFNAIINKLLKSNSESRRRQLRKGANRYASYCTDVPAPRNSNVRHRDLERRMWLHSMGPKHYSDAPGPEQIVQ